MDNFENKYSPLQLKSGEFQSLESKSTSIFFFLFLLFLLIPQWGLAQFYNVPGKAYGEKVISEGNVQYDPTERDLLHFVATSTTMYLEDNYGFNYFLIKKFQAPKGLSIVKLGIKITEESKDVLILLDNGDVYKYHITNEKGAGELDMYAHIYAMVTEHFDKLVGDDIYVLTSLHLYVTRDNGATWQIDSMGLNNAYMRDVDLDTSQNVFAATEKGIFTQGPTSDNWTKLTGYTGNPVVARVFVDRTNRILIGNQTGEIYISHNDGDTWGLHSAGLPAGQFITTFADDTYGNLYAALSNITGTSSELYQSKGGTMVWQKISDGITAITHNPCIINEVRGGSFISVATNFGLFNSGDQRNSWEWNNEGIETENLYSFLQQPNGRKFMSNSLGVYYNDYADPIWHKSYPVNGFASGTKIWKDNAGSLFIQDPNLSHPGQQTSDPLMKSIDNGITWSPDTTGLSKVDGNIFFIDETGNQHYANSIFGINNFNRVWKRAPGGAWSKDTVGLPVMNNTYLVSLGSDRQGFLYVSGNLGGKKVMRRPIAGGTWVIDSVGLTSGINFFEFMTSGPTGGMVAAKSSRPNVFHRGAAKWNSISLPTSIPNNNAFKVTALSVNGNGTIYAAWQFYNIADNSFLGKGVYFTKNLGLTWTFAGLDSLVVTSLVSVGDTTYALTQGHWAYVLTETAVAGNAFISASTNSVCQGGQIHFNNSSSGVPDSIRWSFESGTPAMSIEQNPIITYDIDGHYDIQLIAFYPSHADTLTIPDYVEVKAHPSTIISTGGATSICEGDSIVLSAGDADVYQWSTGAETQDLVVHTEGNYSVTVTGENGCSGSSQPLAIQVNPIPMPTIIPSGPTTFCAGEQVILASDIAGSFLWNTGETTSSIAVTLPGDYILNVSDSIGCSGSSSPITIMVNDLPIIDLGPDSILVQTSTTLDAGNPGASYAWNTGETTPTIFVTQTGLYGVWVTNKNGCSSMDSIFVEVMITGIVQLSNTENVKIFPNPGEGAFTLSSELFTTESLKIQVTNSLGQVVYSSGSEFISGKMNKEIMLNDLSAGMYYVLIQIGENKYAGKLILAKK